MQDVTERKPAYDAEKPPMRNQKHEALDVFLGRWEAEGTSYGGTDPSSSNPKSNGVGWKSSHEGRWHTGKFFLMQDERACVGDSFEFDTFTIMGVDATSDEYFAQSFENHGFERRYQVTRDGDRWTFTGEYERATITLADGNQTQEITWQWKPQDKWLPLCDRVARRIG